MAQYFRGTIGTLQDIVSGQRAEKLRQTTPEYQTALSKLMQMKKQQALMDVFQEKISSGTATSKDLFDYAAMTGDFRLHEQSMEDSAKAAQRKWQEDVEFPHKIKLKQTQPGQGAGFALSPKGTTMMFQFAGRADRFTKDYETIQGNLTNILAATKRLQAMPESDENRLAVNQAVITSFNKITDPTSVVRESEYERTPGGAPLMNRLRAQVEKITKGGNLTREDIREIRDTAVAIADLRRKLINEKIENQIRQPAARRGLNPDEIISPYPAIDWGEDSGVSPNGNKIRVKDSKLSLDGYLDKRMY